MAPHVLDVGDAARFHLAARVVDEISREAIEDVFQRFIEFQLPRSARMAMLDLGISRIEYGNFRAQLLEIEEARLETIVEIGGVVGDFVDEIDQLGFKRRALVQQILGELGILRRGIVVRMLDDAFADLKVRFSPGKST